MEYEIGQAQVYLHRSTTRCPVLNMLTETQTKVFSIGAGGCSVGRSFSHPKFRPDIPCCFNNSSETCRLVPALGQHRLRESKFGCESKTSPAYGDRLRTTDATLGGQPGHSTGDPEA